MHGGQEGVFFLNRVVWKKEVPGPRCAAVEEADWACVAGPKKVNLEFDDSGPDESKEFAIKCFVTTVCKSLHLRPRPAKRTAESMNQKHPFGGLF